MSCPQPRVRPRWESEEESLAFAAMFMKALAGAKPADPAAPSETAAADAAPVTQIEDKPAGKKRKGKGDERI